MLFCSGNLLRNSIKNLSLHYRRCSLSKLVYSMFYKAFKLNFTSSADVIVSAMMLVAGDAFAMLCILGKDPILSCPLKIICHN